MENSSGRPDSKKIKVVALYDKDFQVGNLAHSGKQSSELDFKVFSPTSSHLELDPSNAFIAIMRPALILAQLFGLFPLNGILDDNVFKLRFKLLHWKVFYCFTAFIGSTFLLIFSLIHGFRFGFSFDHAAPIMFYGSSTVSCFLFFNLAKNWSRISGKFWETENILMRYGFPKNQNKIFKIFVTLFCFIAIVEHCLSKIVEYLRISPCWKNQDALTAIKIYFLNQYYQVFSLMHYDLFSGILIAISNFLCTFYWNFTDLFLCLIGKSLSSKLHQINDELTSVRGLLKPETYWRRLREEYNSVSNLVKLVDNHVGTFIFLSVGNNLFFICLQLLKGLKKQINIYQITYFFWSFGFLLLRALVSTFCLAQIYEESKDGKTTLYSVPHESFCSEVKRFLFQINTDEVVLTGCKFFTVTRGLILAVAGTIVTYEIVLVQFQTDIGDVDHWSKENETSHCASDSENLLTFNWISWKMLYNLSNFCGLLFLVIINGYGALLYGIDINRFSATTYALLSLLANVEMTIMAKKWPKFQQSISKFERHFRRHKNQRVHIIRKQLHFVAFIMIFGGTGEYLLSNFLNLIEIDCSDNFLDKYFLDFYNIPVFQIIGYNYIKGYIVSHFYIMVLWYWNFVDIFLAFTAIILSTYIKNFNNFLKEHTSKHHSEQFWRQTREEFNELIMITRKIDKMFNRLVLLSFTSNVFFICLQLLRSLSKKRSAFSTIYFYYSFGFLLARTIYVCYKLSEISVFTKYPRSILFKVPHTSYNREIKRFILQAISEDIVLTAWRLFPINKIVLLKVATTILSYEIILLQFKDSVTKVHQDNYKKNLSVIAGKSINCDIFGHIFVY